MTRSAATTILAVLGLAALVAVAAACGDDGDDGADGGAEPPERLTLVTHDSFAVSDGVFEEFTAETGIEVDQLALGDTGQLVSQAVLTADEPLGDVLFGIDTTFLQRGVEAGIFRPHRSPALDDVPEELHHPDDLVTPVDRGDVCVNVWIDEVPGEGPSTLAELADPAYAGELVVPSPETSSPGLAFLLATVAEFGEDGWEGFWADLRDNDVAVTAGWEDAYYGEFVAGGGDRSLVVSYASSPPAEVIFADPPVDEAPTRALLDSCFRQVEYAGVLEGTPHPEAAGRLVDFLLSPTFQADVPLSMFVFPVVEGTPLPPEFERFAEVPEDPLTLEPEEIEAGRDDWTDRWVDVVLR